MKYHVEMHDFIHLGKANTWYIYFNNMQQWRGVVYELNPTFFDFVDDFLHYITQSSKRFFGGGGWTWRLVVILLFLQIGEVSFNVINPHISITHGFLERSSLAFSSSNSLS